MVAAGSGSRLGADVPKALVALDGVPLVRRSVDALAAGGVSRVVVTVPADRAEDFTAALVGAPVPVRTVVGGARRQDSVHLGLLALAEDHDDAVVLVHDAARPLVPADVVARVVRAVLDGAPAVVPAVAVNDSVRTVDGTRSTVVDRALLRAVQTPQGFRLRGLVEAHEHLRASGREVTDDAAACEVIGLAVTIVPGHRDAMKITEPLDLLLASAICQQRGTP